VGFTGEETFVSYAYVFWGRTTFTSGHRIENELEAKKTRHAMHA